jgi:Mn-containing catalase
MLSFLIARDTMHQQQWLAAIEDLGDTFASAPNDVPDEGDYAKHAYAFFNHSDSPEAELGRWTQGESLDGKGAFSVGDPHAVAGPEPELMGGPASVHAGVEATRANGDGSVVDKVKDAVEKIT